MTGDELADDIFEPWRRVVAVGRHDRGLFRKFYIPVSVWRCIRTPWKQIRNQNVKIDRQEFQSIGYYHTCNGLLLDCYWWLVTSSISGDYARPKRSKNPSDSCTECFVRNYDILNFPNKRTCDPPISFLPIANRK